MLADFTINKFMEELSTGDPVPGGGSVAAMCGAVATGLISMVADLTVGRKGYEQISEEFSYLKSEMEKKREEFLDLMDRDSEAYAKVVECFKLSKDTEAEKEARTEAVQAATLEAALMPLSIAEKAGILFDGAEAVTRYGNKNATSDGAIAAMMARTAVLGALYSVRINAVTLKDEKEKKALLERAYAVEKAARQRETAILELVSF